MVHQHVVHLALAVPEVQAILALGVRVHGQRVQQLEGKKRETHSRWVVGDGPSEGARFKPNWVIHSLPQPFNKHGMPTGLRRPGLGRTRPAFLSLTLVTATQGPAFLPRTLQETFAANDT